LYTIRITNAAGCVTNDSIQVRVFNEYTVFVPSGFSPDGDGVNDKLNPLLAGIKELKNFRVYNRWGQLLYQTNDKNAGWNGTYNGKLQISETYVWVVEAIDQDGKNILKTGKTTLIR
jgi:gliding motility-associated-like protein